MSSKSPPKRLYVPTICEPLLSVSVLLDVLFHVALAEVRVNVPWVLTLSSEALFSVGTCDEYYFGICSELINDGVQIVIHSKDKIRKIL